MPDAVAVSVAKAVTTMLAGASLSQAFTPERSYADWAKPLETNELGSTGVLTVDVVGHTTEQTVQAATRGSEPKTRHGVTVDIAVRKKFGPDKHDKDHGRVLVEEVDALVYLVQEIHEFFHLQRMSAFEAGAWESTTIVANPIREHLKDMKQFTGIVRLAFVVLKTPGMS